MTKLDDAIRESCMLVSLNTSGWTARFRDAEASKAADDAKGATTGTYNAWGNMMKDNDDRLRLVNKIIGQAGVLHRKLTRPWAVQDNTKGPRMIPTNLVLDYMGQMRTLRNELKAAREDFIDNYETDREAARVAIKMPAADAVALYPRKEDLAKKFDLHIHFEPIPVSAQFAGLRFGGKDEAQDQAVEQLLQTKYNDAMNVKYMAAEHKLMQDALKDVETLIERSSGDGNLQKTSWELVSTKPVYLDQFNILESTTVAEAVDEFNNVLNKWGFEDLKSLEYRDGVVSDLKTLSARLVTLLEENYTV